MSEERFTLTEEAPAPPSLYGFARRFGVLDRETNRGDGMAMLPDGTLCWGMTQDRALDALIELRGGARAERDYERAS